MFLSDVSKDGNWEPFLVENQFPVGKFLEIVCPLAYQSSLLVPLVLQSADEEKIIHLGKSNLMFVCWRKKKKWHNLHHECGCYFNPYYTKAWEHNGKVQTASKTETSILWCLHNFGCLQALVVKVDGPDSGADSEFWKRWFTIVFTITEKLWAILSGRKTWSTSSSRWIIRTGA